MRLPIFVGAVLSSRHMRGGKRWLLVPLRQPPGLRGRRRDLHALWLVRPTRTARCVRLLRRDVLRAVTTGSATGKAEAQAKGRRRRGGLPW